MTQTEKETLAHISAVAAMLTAEIQKLIAMQQTVEVNAADAASAKAALAELVQKVGKDSAAKVLSGFQAHKFSELKPVDYVRFIEEAKKACHGTPF